MRLTTKILGIAIVAAGLVQPVSAAVLYDYDATNDYVSGDESLRKIDGTAYTGGDAGRAFSTNAMQPISGYTGPAFFGGFEADAGAANFENANVDSSGKVGGDPIHFDMPNNNNVRFDAVVMGSVGLAQFDATSSVTVGAIRTSSQTNATASARLVFGIGSTYYVSTTEVLSSIGKDSVDSVTLDNTGLDALSFQVYDPGTAIAYDGGAAGAAFDPFVNNFDSVGVLLKYDRQAGSGRNGLGLQLYQLTVDATVIPEPASMALLGLGGLMMFARKRG